MAAVQSAIASYTAGRTVEEILRACGEAGIPVQRVNTLESLAEDDYLRERGTVEEVRHPLGYSYLRTTPNISFSDAPLGPVRPATAVDADREDIEKWW